MISLSMTVKQADMERLAVLRDQLYEHPRLTYLFFELTDACNLACLHCGSSACPQNHTYLPADDVRRIMRRIAEAYDPHNIMICFTGGEPLLHPDLCDLIACARQYGFTCGITSNGTLIDPDMARRLVQSGLNSVSFSVDGLQDTHDWFRNRPGAFERSLRGIRNLLEASRGTVVTQITSVMHKKNFHQLDALYELAVQIGVDSWRPINLEPIGRALSHNDLLLDADQLRTLLTYIRDKRFSAQVEMDVTYGCAHFLTEEFEHMVRDSYFICGSGIFVASVLCNGDIYSCLDIERRPELVQGNIAQDDFVEIWETRFQAFRRDRTASCASCRACTDRRYCRGDAAHTWDYDTDRPMLCMKQLFENKGEHTYETDY